MGAAPSSVLPTADVDGLPAALQGRGDVPLHTLFGAEFLAASLKDAGSGGAGAGEDGQRRQWFPSELIMSSDAGDARLRRVSQFVSLANAGGLRGNDLESTRATWTDDVVLKSLGGLQGMDLDLFQGRIELIRALHPVLVERRRHAQEPFTPRALLQRSVPSTASLGLRILSSYLVGGAAPAPNEMVFAQFQTLAPLSLFRDWSGAPPPAAAVAPAPGGLTGAFDRSSVGASTTTTGSLREVVDRLAQWLYRYSQTPATGGKGGSRHQRAMCRAALLRLALATGSMSVLVRWLLLRLRSSTTATATDRLSSASAEGLSTEGTTEESGGGETKSSSFGTQSGVDTAEDTEATLAALAVRLASPPLISKKRSTKTAPRSPGRRQTPLAANGHSDVVEGQIRLRSL